MKTIVKYIFLAGIFIVLLAACNKKKSASSEPEICGLASPVLFTGDSVKFDLRDYFNDLSAIIEVHFPQEMEITKGPDSGVYYLNRTPKLPLLSVIEVTTAKGYEYSILVKNLRSDKVSIQYNPGNTAMHNAKVRGSLNRWNVLISKMSKGSDGNWIEEFNLPPGEYQYHLVLDGKEICDPSNPDSIDNNMGGYNSLLKVGKYRQEDLPFISTVSFKKHQILFQCNSSMKEVYAFWQNKRARSVLHRQSITVEIPSEAAMMERSYIRVSGYNESGISNDLLIPLEKGNVITDASKLSRSDRQTMILYFMMIDRFYDGNPANDHPVNDPEILPKANYYGGDIQGIYDKLEAGYFDSLGINTLWLSPITQNPLTAYGLYKNPRTRFSGYHGYWPISSTKIDFRLGDSAALKTLIDSMHGHNMNILLDYVASHVHELHPVYKTHPDWFTPLYLPDGTMNTERWDEYRLTTWFDVFLPKLDLSNPKVAGAMSDSALFWISHFGFDGFRHDATKHIDELFWRTLTRKLKEYSQCNPIPFQIGETYGSPELISSYIGSGMLDAQFDFNVYDDEVAVFAHDKESFVRLKNSLTQSLRYYGYHNLMGYISGNQDRPRFISLAGGDLKFNEDSKYAGWTRQIGVGDSLAYDKLVLMQTFNMTIPGIPTIYYGDEIGLPGANDPDNRRWMKFNGLNAKERMVKQDVCRLTHFRSRSMALLYGDLQFIRADEKVLVYIRRYFNDFALVIFNKTGSAEEVNIDSIIVNSDSIHTLFNSEYKKTASGFIFYLKPYSCEIITSR
jgi:cyclomaltodextrinase / maltogenic alpha-amylase / neopullulanase